MNDRNLLDYPDQPSLWKVNTPYLNYVLKLHIATSRHYDFRLELNGKLISWVLREPPSLNPLQSRIAIPVDDHQLSGLLAERRIPEGKAGAGPMLVNDHGVYAPHPFPDESHQLAVRAALMQGRLDFRMDGHRLRGLWRIEKTGSLWSLCKLPDEFATEETLPWDDRSVLTGRGIEEI